MNRFDFFATPIAGLHRVVSHQLGDSRGYLARAFCAQEFSAVGWSGSVAQANLTYTRLMGTVRGLHFQHPPHAEDKLVRCLRGEIWDVVVDLRKDSPTFLKWHAEVLSAKNMSAFLIPQGCAHGFQSLTDNVEMLYLHSEAYAATSEDGLNVNDPVLAIEWPLPHEEVSPRDRSFSYLPDDFKGISLL